jgi:DNA-binding transcriptional MerR regulator
MQIGSVAKRIGLTPDAIRFYERNELLPRPPRTEGGFRLYGESDVETLAFIRLCSARSPYAHKKVQLSRATLT